MEENEIIPTGPPPVGKGTPISVKGAGKSNPEPKKSIKVEEPDKTEEPIPDFAADEPSTQSVPASSPVPVTAADKDLQSIDMGDDIDKPSNTPQFAPPKNKKGGGKKLVMIFITILIIAALAAGAWWFLKKPKAKTTSPPTTQSNNTTATTPAQPETATIKTYKGDAIKVELSYPSTWKAIQGTNQVAFTSPQISYTKKDGSTAKGTFTVVIKKGFTQDDSTTINNAVAVKTSELIKYTAPAAGQRTESYLSFLGKDQNSFMFLMITSGKQYMPGNTVAATLPLTQDSYIVYGGYGTDDKGQKSISFDIISPDKIQQNTEVYNQAVEIIKSLKING